jgi:hypothetical protein
MLKHVKRKGDIKLEQKLIEMVAEIKSVKTHKETDPMKQNNSRCQCKMIGPQENN